MHVEEDIAESEYRKRSRDLFPIQGIEFKS